MAGKTKARRRREVELLLLSGRGLDEIAESVKVTKETVRSDIEFLQEEWSRKPQAEGAWEKRVATLRAMSQYALSESQSEKNPPATRIAWFQGWQKMADELAKLTGVGKYAERRLLIPESLQGQDIEHIQYAYRLFWITLYEGAELRDEVIERGLMSREEVSGITKRGREKAWAAEEPGPYLEVQIKELAG